MFEALDQEFDQPERSKSMGGAGVVGKAPQLANFGAV
jgi:hypothetical protein